MRAAAAGLYASCVAAALHCAAGVPLEGTFELYGDGNCTATGPADVNKFVSGVCGSITHSNETSFSIDVSCTKKNVAEWTKTDYIKVGDCTGVPTNVIRGVANVCEQQDQGADVFVLVHAKCPDRPQPEPEPEPEPADKYACKGDTCVVSAVGIFSRKVDCEARCGSTPPPSPPTPISPAPTPSPSAKPSPLSFGGLSLPVEAAILAAVVALLSCLGVFCCKLKRTCCFKPPERFGSADYSYKNLQTASVTTW